MRVKILRNCFFSLCLLFLLPGLFLSQARASTWNYPMTRYFERQTLKEFGQLVDQNFYKGKKAFFPFNRFYGYHSGVDLEIFPEEKDQKVPVYAIGPGKITFIGKISGYGGVILESLREKDRTVLYGHVKIAGLSLKVDNQVIAGQEITFLGDAFSAETAKERKHLHFGIYIGNDLYFKGHESSQKQLLTKWEDPNRYLTQKGAVFLDPPKKSTSSPSIDNKTSASPDLNVFNKMMKLLKGILSRIFGV